ncbi:MAG: hypothetical protein RLZZ405_851 [Verrucomicrobiota bacterium]
MSADSGRVSETPADPQPSRPRRGFWQRLGGEGLTISLLIHGALILIAAIWVISTVTDSVKKDPDSFSTGSGGGAAGDKAKAFKTRAQPKNPKSLAKTTTRITSKSANAAIALPDLPTTSMASLNSGMMGGGSSKGFGGGTGGGIGSGTGIGVGNGRNFVSLFGGRGIGNGLVGEFWDIKRAKDKKPLITLKPGVSSYGYTDEEISDYFRAIRKVITAKGDATAALDKFFHADAVLSANGIFQPTMSASEAPKAFGVEKEVAPVLWLGVYRGRIRAPFADQFRFVGGCDNVMVIIANGKVVLDGSLKHMPGSSVQHYYAADWKQTTEPVAGVPARAPTNNFNFVYGDWIKMDPSTDTDVTIILGESGGAYGAFLTVDYKTAKWHKKGGELPPGGFLPVFLVGKPDGELRELMEKAGAPAGVKPFLDGPIFTAGSRGPRR